MSQQEFETGDLTNDNVRREIYEDWDWCSGYLGRLGIDQFCICKGITIDELIDIIKEFEKE